MKASSFLLAALVAALSFARLEPAYAAPASSAAVSGMAQPLAKLPGLVEKVHGFHCRMAFGYDPRVGYRRWHRHPRACRGAGVGRRCVRVRSNCRDVFGRGPDYRRCVRRRGCRL